MTQPRSSIFFLISKQHFIPTGGIGSFFRGFLRMANQIGWRVIVVLDMKPIGQGREMMEACPSAEYIWPKHPCAYATHNPGPFPGKETINKFRVQNFATALQLKLANGVPGHILINTPEAVIATNQLGLPAHIPTTFYTHHENLVVPPEKASRVFARSYNEFIDSVPAMPGITTATQCSYNLARLKRLEFSRPCLILPMPIPDRGLMEPLIGPRKGVLFIGRHEARKDPKFFAKTLAETGLPAKVLTNKRSIKLFKTTFAKAGITDFEIKGQIIGQEKVNFIRGARVAFHPARLESYGFSAMETLAAGLPTLLLEERAWWQSFRDDGVLTTTCKTAAEDLLALYQQEPPRDQSKWNQREQDTFRTWREYLAHARH